MAIQGAGLGFRAQHFENIVHRQPDIGWFEILADNHLSTGGVSALQAEHIAERYPVVLHGVNLSLGSADGIDTHYLSQIKALKQRLGAVWYSEHCSFSRYADWQSPDLLPMPYTEQSLKLLVSHIQQVQETLGERMLVENVSAYIGYPQAEWSEAEFLAELVTRADCYLLLDINNVYVNSYNFGFDARAYIEQLPVARIKQLHLAGFQPKDDFLLDTHNQAIAEPVWQLFSDCVELIGDIPTMIEWDHNIPPFNTLLNDYQRLAAFFRRSQQREHCAVS